MKNIWKIQIWGVRGSFPVPDTRFLTYGGNTSCILAEYGDTAVILDAGSGLIPLGRRLAEKRKKKVYILLSHLHIDHIMGLYRFPLLYDPEAEIHLYGEGANGAGLSERLKTLIGAPYWPLPLSSCPARITVHETGPKEHFLLPEKTENAQSIHVHTLRGNHPGESLLYRLDTGDKSLVYALDCEMDEAMLHSLPEFSRNAGLIIWDANFTEADLKSHRGWGHSSWKEGIDLCRTANIGKILMTHYSSEYTDKFLENEEKKAEQPDIDCCFAKEGMKLQI